MPMAFQSLRSNLSIFYACFFFSGPNPKVAGAEAMSMSGAGAVAVAVSVATEGPINSCELYRLTN